MDYKPENNGYNYGYPNYQPEQPKKKKRGRIIAICLVCIILAGAAGAGVGVLAASMSDFTVSRVEAEKPHLPNSGNAQPEPTESIEPEPTTTPAPVPTSMVRTFE